MSRQIYWGVIEERPVGKKRMFPFKLYARAYYAKIDCREKNEFEKRFKRRKTFTIERYVLDFKGVTHYDVYKHEIKRI